MPLGDQVPGKSATAIIANPEAVAPRSEPDFVFEELPEPVSLRDRVAVIRQNYLVILAVAAIATGLAAYTVTKAVPIYRASAVVRLNDMRSNLTSGVGTNASSQMSWDVDPVKSQMELLPSRATAEDAVERGKLQLRELGPFGSIGWLDQLDAKNVRRTDTLSLQFGDYAISARLGKATSSAPYGARLAVGSISFIVPSRPGSPSAKFLVIPPEAAISAVQGGLKSKRREETDISDLQFDSPDPYFAQRALNAAVTSFQALNMLTAQEAARARREFLDKQLRKTDSVLESQRTQLSVFRSAKQAFSSKDKIAAEQGNLMTVRMRREELQGDRQVYASLVARAEAAQKSGDPNGIKALITAPGISNNPAILQVYNEYARLRSSRDSMTTGASAAAPSNPDLQRLDELIRSSSAQLINAVKSQIETFDARIAALDALSSRSAAQASGLPQTEAEETRLVQQAEGTQKMTEQLREEQQRARISEVAQVGQVQIIDLARTPGSPINSGQSRKIIFAALLGLALGVGLTLLLDSFDTSLRRISDAERILRLPTLGAIPELSGAKPAIKRLRFPSLRLSDVQVNKDRPADSDSHNGRKTVPVRYINPSLPAFESFRALRTSLIFSNAVHALKSIVVTSAAAGDGKSTTATNLAAAFAQQGIRALIMDCDLRRGRLHAAFDYERSPGLMEVVVGECTLAEAIHPTSIPNLYLLTAGKQPPNPTELLGSDPVRNILLQLTSDYDLVIIDTPPVLAAADAVVLSSVVDGVILVVRVGVTDRRAAKRSLERLQIVGARVLGTVLNDPQEILGTSEDYYYYQYRYAERKKAAV